MGPRIRLRHQGRTLVEALPDLIAAGVLIELPAEEQSCADDVGHDYAPEPGAPTQRPPEPAKPGKPEQLTFNYCDVSS